MTTRPNGSASEGTLSTRPEESTSVSSYVVRLIAAGALAVLVNGKPVQDILPESSPLKRDTNGLVDMAKGSGY